MAGTPSLRLSALVAVLLALALPSAALAVTDSVAFSGRLAMASAPSAAAPADTGFNWAHHITTSPAGSQPDTADSFKVLFPSPLILNAQDFPSCPATSADGHTTLSDECRNAMVGSGTASMYAGSPGSPLSNSVREDLTVTVLNGAPAGSAILLLLNSTPSAPVAITNRVMTGKVTPEAGYAFAAEFVVPSDLQKQLGLSIVISDLDVTISGTPRPITAGSTKDISYLQLPDCAGTLSARQLTHFAGANPTMLTNDAAIECAIGSFPDPPGLPTGPYTSPRVPADTSPMITFTRDPANLGRVKARKNGRILLPGVQAFCPHAATAPCTITANAKRGHVAVAALSMRVTPGAVSPLALKLTAAGKRLLARSRSLKLRVTVKATPQTLRLTLVR